MGVSANYVARVNMAMFTPISIARNYRVQRLGILALCSLAYIGSAVYTYACPSCGDKTDIPISYYSYESSQALSFSSKVTIGETKRALQSSLSSPAVQTAKDQFKIRVKPNDFTVTNELHYQSGGHPDFNTWAMVKIRVPCGVKGVTVEGHYLKIDQDPKTDWYSDGQLISSSNGHYPSFWVGRSDYENEHIFESVQNPKAEKQTWLSLVIMDDECPELDQNPTVSYSFHIKFDFKKMGDPDLGSFKSGFEFGEQGAVSWYSEHIADCLELDSVSFASGNAANGELVDGASKKQLRIPSGGLAEAESTSGHLSIRIFDESQVGAVDGSGFYTHTGNPTQKAEISDAGSGLINYKLYSGTSLTGDWTFGEASSPTTFSMLDNLTGQKEVKINDLDGNGDKTASTETWQVTAGQPDSLISKVTNTYHVFTNGDDSFEGLIKSVEDPNGAALTTQYGYGITPSTKAYGQQISVNYPDGSWMWTQYDGIATGVKQITWSPFKDASFPSALPTSDTGYVKEIEYEDGSEEVYTNGFLTSKSGSSSSSGDFSGATGLGLLVSNQWFSTGSYLSTKTYTSPDTGRVVAAVNADGTCTTYSYTNGTYNTSTGTFTADVNGPDLLTLQAQGKVNNAGDDQDLIEDQSTATETIENADGKLLQQRKLLYHGSGFNTVLSTTKNIYTGENLTQVTRNGVTIYSATYDSGGNLQTSTDEFGTLTTFTSVGRTTTTTTNDGAGNLASIVTADVTGRVLSEITNGLTTGYSYSVGSGGGRIVTVTLPSGATSVSEYYRDGQIKSVSGSAETAASYDYSATAGSFSTIQTLVDGSNSRVTTTVSDMAGRTISITHPAFNTGTVTETYHYNGSGQLTSITSDSSAATQAFTYDALGNQLWSGLDMDSSGLSEGSSQDRITKTEQYYSTANSNWYAVTKTSKHLPSGWINLQEVWNRVDGLEGIIKGPNNHTVTTSYAVDRPNKMTTVTVNDSLVGTSSSVYWSNNRIKERQEPFQYGSSAKTSYSYYTDGSGKLQTMTDAASRPTGYSYYGDGVLGAGQLNTTTLPGGATVSRTYTSKGQLSVESGTGTYYKHYAYNGFGELTGLAIKRNSTEVWTTWERDPGTGLISSKSYNGAGTVNYGYNAAGYLTTRTWARSITTTYGRNAAGDVTSVTYSDGTTPGASSMGYDSGGRLTSVTDASGIRSISYSDFGQRATEAYTGTGILSGKTVVRTYSGARRTGLGAAGSQVSYPDLSYNYTGERLSSISTQGQERTMTYGPQAGMLRPASITSSTGDPLSDEGTVTTGYGYDTLGRLTRAGTSVHVSGTLSAYGTTTNPIHYDTPGRRDVIPREDGSQWTYGYNTRDEVTSGGKKFSGGTLYVPGHQFTYTYDGIGNRSSASIGGDTVGAGLEAISYTPSDLNQYSAYTNPISQWITGEAVASANVFVNGQWTWRNGTFFGGKLDLGNGSGAVAKAVTVESKLPPNGGNMVVATQTGTLLKASASVSPTYDSDGNLTSDGLWNYTWDGENRLVSLETASSLPTAAQHKTTFVYDFEGRRVAKNGYIKSGSSWVADSNGTTRMLYDDWNLLEEKNSVVDRCYIWGLDLSGTLDGAGGIGGLLAMDDEVSGKTYWYANDANGNVSALVDASTGAIVARYEYGVFAEPLRASGPMAKINPFRFSSRYTDNESGLVHFPGGTRDLQPPLGRWLQRDPINELGFKALHDWVNSEIGMPEEANLYAFVGNNPVSKFDPLGLFVPKLGQPPGRGVDLNLHSQGTHSPDSNPSQAFDDDESFTVMGHGLARGVDEPFMQDEHKEAHDQFYYIDKYGKADGPKKFKQNEPKPENISPNQLAGMIRRDKKWNDSCNVVLYSCQTGYGGPRSFAQSLAKILKATVYAPTDTLWIGGGVPSSIDNNGTFQRFDPPK